MPPRGQTRQRIVQTTSRLLVTQGVHATGLNQVLAESGVPRGSLYFHFPGGKLELAVEAVLALGVELGDTLRAFLDEKGSVESGVRALCAMFARQLQGSGYRRGCPIATVSLEAGGGPPELLDACADIFQGWEGELARRLQAEGLPGQRAGAAASNLLALIEGALLLAKAQRDVAPLHRAAEAVSAVLVASRVPAARRRK
jgi:TetR/AcrR family transcriptional repressor of lmrAB and yxaGH operons